MEEQLQEELVHDSELEEGSGTQSEAREAVRVAGLTEDEVKAKLQKLEELSARTTQYETQLQRIQADEEYQRLLQERAQVEAQQNAAIADYQAKIEEVESLKALASQQAAAGDKASAQSTWNKAVKKQHALENSMVEQKLAPILDNLPQYIEARVLEMLKPNLLGQYLQSSVGDDVPGIGQMTAQFRSLLSSGRVDDNALAEFVKNIVTTVKGSRKPDNVVQFGNRGLGMESVNDASMRDAGITIKDINTAAKRLVNGIMKS